MKILLPFIKLHVCRVETQHTQMNQKSIRFWNLGNTSIKYQNPKRNAVKKSTVLATAISMALCTGVFHDMDQLYITSINEYSFIPRKHHSSGRFRNSQTGSQPQSGVLQRVILAIYPKWSMKLKRNWTLGLGCSSLVLPPCIHQSIGQVGRDELGSNISWLFLRFPIQFI